MAGDRNKLWEKSLEYIQGSRDRSQEESEYSSYLLKSFVREKDEEINRELLKELIEKYSGVVRELEEKVEVIQKMSMTDGLTGIYNRKKFTEEFGREVKRHGRSREGLTLAVMDIDHFKRVNDTYGHEMGDRILIEFCRIVMENIREVDIFARWGGEEFALIVVGSSKEGARIVLERVRERIEEHNFDHGERLTCSIGSVTVEDAVPEEMFTKADKALYRAKKNGRNRVEYWKEY